MADQTFDDAERVCPYCGYRYQPEAASYRENTRVEECDGCGKKFHAHDDFTVTHYAMPDCELNGEEHDRSEKVLSARVRPYCTKCNKLLTPNVKLSEQPEAVRSDAGLGW